MVARSSTHALRAGPSRAYAGLALAQSPPQPYLAPIRSPPPAALGLPACPKPVKLGWGLRGGHRIRLQQPILAPLTAQVETTPSPSPPATVPLPSQYLSQHPEPTKMKKKPRQRPLPLIAAPQRTETDREPPPHLSRQARTTLVSSNTLQTNAQPVEVICDEGSYGMILKGFREGVGEEDVRSFLERFLDQEEKVPTIEVRRDDQGSALVVVQGLSQATHERLLRTLSQPAFSQPPSHSSFSSSILGESSKSLQPWAEDLVTADQQRWTSISSVLGREGAGAGKTLTVDRLSKDGFCDELGWHFVVRYKEEESTRWEKRLEEIVQLVENGFERLSVRETICRLPLSKSTKSGYSKAYLLLPHSARVLQPAFNDLLSRSSKDSFSISPARPADLERLLKPVVPLTSSSAKSSDVVHFAYPSEFNDLHLRSLGRLTDPDVHDEAIPIEQEWWKPEFQLSRALAWMHHLRLFSTGSPWTRRRLLSTTSFFASLPSSLPFATTPTAPRSSSTARASPTKVYLSGLPLRYQTIFLTRYLRSRPDLGSWVQFLRRAPSQRVMDVLEDLKDQSGLRMLKREASGDQNGKFGRERVGEWLGKTLVKAEVEKLPLQTSQELSEFVVTVPSASDAHRLVRLMDGKDLFPEAESPWRYPLTVRCSF